MPITANVVETLLILNFLMVCVILAGRLPTRNPDAWEALASPITMLRPPPALPLLDIHAVVLLKANPLVWTLLVKELNRSTVLLTVLRETPGSWRTRCMPTPLLCPLTSRTTRQLKLSLITPETPPGLARPNVIPVKVGLSTL